MLLVAPPTGESDSLHLQLTDSKGKGRYFFYSDPDITTPYNCTASKYKKI